MPALTLVHSCCRRICASLSEATTVSCRLLSSFRASSSFSRTCGSVGHGQSAMSKVAAVASWQGLPGCGLLCGQRGLLCGQRVSRAALDSLVGPGRGEHLLLDVGQAFHNALHLHSGQLKHQRLNAAPVLGQVPQLGVVVEEGGLVGAHRVQRDAILQLLGGAVAHLRRATRGGPGGWWARQACAPPRALCEAGSALPCHSH